MGQDQPAQSRWQLRYSQNNLKMRTTNNHNLGQEKHCDNEWSKQKQGVIAKRHEVNAKGPVDKEGPSGHTEDIEQWERTHRGGPSPRLPECGPAASRQSPPRAQSQSPLASQTMIYPNLSSNMCKPRKEEGRGIKIGIPALTEASEVVVAMY